MVQSSAARLRQLIAQKEPTIAPVAYDPTTAILAQASGFQAIYLGGGASGYLKGSIEPNLSISQLAQAAVEIRTVCSLPIILDGQCGWGDPMHQRHSIAKAEASGVAAIEIEDQLMPKRAHHHVGIEHMIPADLMVEKIKVAADTRRDPDFVIIARTNAGSHPGNLDETVRRADAYKRAGADMLFALMRNPEEAYQLARRVEGPYLYMAIGLEKLVLSELGDLGYKLIVDPLTPFLAAHKAMRLAYEAMSKRESDPTLGSEALKEIEHVHQTINLDDLLNIERRTVER